MFARESAWLLVSTPSNPTIHFSCVRERPQSVDKLTKPKWNCRPISWPRPLPRRPFVSRLDAKQNYNRSHRPLWREWVGRCPLTKSTKNDKLATWHAHSKEQRQFTLIHPSIEQAAKHFVLSSHAKSFIQSLNQITENRLSRMCNDMSMGKQNSRLHVRIVQRVWRKSSIRQFP